MAFAVCLFISAIPSNRSVNSKESATPKNKTFSRVYSVILSLRTHDIIITPFG